MRTFSLPYPFGPRARAAQEVDARTTVPGIGPLFQRDEPAAFVPNRPGPRSPLASPLHPYLARAMGLVLDARAYGQLDNAPKVAPRIELSVAEQERVRGLRGVVTRLRTPPRSYDTGYNAAPLGPGTAIARPLPGMDTLARATNGLPCVDCR